LDFSSSYLLVNSTINSVPIAVVITPRIAVKGFKGILKINIINEDQPMTMPIDTIMKKDRIKRL